METRNVELTLEKAQEWYEKGGDLKEVALQAFTEEELKELSFEHIKTFEDACFAVDLFPCEVNKQVREIKCISKASAAAYKLNIIRKALNKGKKTDFTKGAIWYPYTPIVLPRNSYGKNSYEVEVAKVKIGCDTFTLLGGRADIGANLGLGCFYSNAGVACSYTNVGFLGCATKEVAQHMGKYFPKEIFEAKYGDTVDFEWI